MKQESEILNTAVLNGRTVAVPVKCSSELGSRCYGPQMYDREDVDGGGGGRAREESGGCVAQYQSTTVRVLTHFMADTGEEERAGGGVSAAAADEAANQQDFLLGTDWQVDVTHLVAESLKVKDPKTARFLQGQVLMGLSPGTTKVQ
ncbi:hypothetical protein CRUP_023329, partial [Coryphaenoides rupestris]